MSGEACVVASSCGQVTELIKDGYNGFLAKTSDDWVNKLDQLLTNENLRKQMRKNGLETVRKNNSLEFCFEKLLIALDF